MFQNFLKQSEEKKSKNKNKSIDMSNIQTKRSKYDNASGLSYVNVNS